MSIIVVRHPEMFFLAQKTHLKCIFTVKPRIEAPLRKGARRLYIGFWRRCLYLGQFLSFQNKWWSASIRSLLFWIHKNMRKVWLCRLYSVQFMHFKRNKSKKKTLKNPCIGTTDACISNHSVCHVEIIYFLGKIRRRRLYRSTFLNFRICKKQRNPL